MNFLESLEDKNTKTPELLFEQFEQSYGQSLMEAIKFQDVYASPYFLNIVPQRYQALGKNIVVSQEKIFQVVYEREMAFCRHMIFRLSQILQRALSGEETMTIGFTTSMLCDVDDTLGSTIQKWHIRPGVLFLFTFFREKFPHLNIGLCTTRSFDKLQKQLRDSEALGSLAEISNFINPEFVFSINQNDANLQGEYVSNNMDYSLFPHALKTSLAGHLEYLYGWNDDRVHIFIAEELPLIYEQYWRQNAIRLLAFDLMDEENSRISEMSEKEEEAEQKVYGFGDFMEQASRQISLDYAKEQARRSFESFIANPLNIFLLMSDEIKIESAGRLDGIPPNIIADVKHRISAVMVHNRNLVSQTLTRLYGITTGEYTVQMLNIVLSRLSAAKNLLDKNNSNAVAIAVDNNRAAEFLDQLLQGRLKNGKDIFIDGYEFLHLERYRNRLYVIHCGKRGEYNLDDILHDIALAT